MSTVNCHRGDEIKPIVIKVPTYQGPDSKVDFAEPLVPVTVENECGIIVTLGKTTETYCPPSIVCERRKNGWAIFISPQSGGDHNLLYYVIDECDPDKMPETVVVFDGIPSEYPRVAEQPPGEIDEEPVTLEGARA